jgi:hypothetical protein
MRVAGGEGWETWCVPGDLAKVRRAWVSTQLELPGA